MEIEKDHLIWLEALYEDFKREIKSDKRELQLKLWDKLSKVFSPNEVHNEFYNQEKITLSGIWLIDKENKLFDNCDKIISTITKILKELPEEEYIKISSIEEETKLIRIEIEKAIQLLYEYGGFLSGTTGSSDPDIAIESFSVSESHFNSYKTFKDIRTRISNRVKIRLESDKKHQRLMRRKSGINSIAKPSPTQEIKNTAFIIMQINKEDSSLVDNHIAIKEVCKDFGIKAIRVDEITHQEKITDIIIEQIEKAEFIIGDLTNERPNVYYEIGYAHALGKRPMLVRKKGSKIHFDLSGYNVPEYDNNSELKFILHKWLEDITRRNPKNNSPL